MHRAAATTAATTAQHPCRTIKGKNRGGGGLVWSRKEAKIIFFQLSVISLVFVHVQLHHQHIIHTIHTYDIYFPATRTAQLAGTFELWKCVGLGLLYRQVMVEKRTLHGSDIIIPGRCSTKYLVVVVYATSCYSSSNNVVQVPEAHVCMNVVVGAVGWSQPSAI